MTDKPSNVFHTAHYNALAKEIRELFPIRMPEALDSVAGRELLRIYATERGILCALAINLAKRFQEDNPRFDPIRFLETCSPDNDIYPLTEFWEEDQLDD